MKIKLVIGLGNPGAEYERTRHNAGFMFVDALAKKIFDESDWKEEPKLFSAVLKVRNIVLAKPQTFMNASGKAVGALIKFYKIKPTDVLLIHDDVDIPLAEARLQFDRSSAGHKGVESVMRALKTQKFARLRIGVGPKRGHKEAMKVVLQKFSAPDYTDLAKHIKKWIPSIELWIKEGLPAAQMKFAETRS